jgi:glyoxylase-like metal-dependent hydrolase (beta-lactamase superfamily II)
MTGDGNWTWLLRGRVPTLIDAGTGDPAFIADLQRALGGDTLAQVVVTHAHTDHASGAPALHALMPGARFRKMPWPERDAKWPAGWQPLADGQVIEAGDTRLTAVYTPGHAPDHLCFWHEETRSLFCGDLALRGTTVYIPTSLRGDLSAYLASLERVLGLNPARMYPAHGPVIDEPAKLLTQYLEHRREREVQVLDALRAGDTSPDAMVRRIYPRLSAPLLPIARETMLAHLMKLEGEGRARREQDAWHIMEP